VAGVAGLLLSHNPDLTNAQVRQILRDSADDLGTAGHDKQYGWGRVNAANALSMAGSPDDVSSVPPDTCVSSGNSDVDPTNGEIIGALHSFRDEVLATTSEGQHYIDLYNQFSPEVALILATDSELRTEVQEFLADALPAIQSTLPGTASEVTLSNDLIDQAEAISEDIANAGSDELQDAIDTIWNDIDSDEQVGKPVSEVVNDVIADKKLYLPIIQR
jgi:hypothetical protein